MNFCGPMMNWGLQVGWNFWVPIAIMYNQECLLQSAPSCNKYCHFCCYGHQQGDQKQAGRQSKWTPLSTTVLHRMYFPSCFIAPGESNAILNSCHSLPGQKTTNGWKLMHTRFIPCWNAKGWHKPSKPYSAGQILTDVSESRNRTTVCNTA